MPQLFFLAKSLPVPYIGAPYCGAAQGCGNGVFHFLLCALCNRLKKFKKIYIEITSRCNLSCSFCHKSGRAKAFMQPADFALILAKIKGHTEHLSLHVLGEPLLHPDLAEILDLCHERGFKVNLTTNGTLLGKNTTMLLASPALRQINISLHSLADTAGPVFERYLADILDFMQEAMLQGRLLLCLRLWNATGEKQLEAGRRNEAVFRRLESFFALPMPLSDALTPGHGLTLAPRVFLSQNQRFTWPHASGPDLGDNGFCHGLRTHAAILVDGTVVPCCLDAEADIPLGNIFQHGFGEILESPRAIRMRQSFSARRVVEPLCRRCSFRQGF